MVKVRVYTHPLGKYGTPEERFDRRVSPEPNTGCWLWEGVIDPCGYGRLGGNLAHRISWERFVGPIPKDLQIDHLCRVRCCVNPVHLEPVLPVVNTHRGNAMWWAGERQKAKTHCKFGHSFSGANLYIRSNGARSCKACLKIRTQRDREKINLRKRVARLMKQAPAEKSPFPPNVNPSDRRKMGWPQ